MRKPSRNKMLFVLVADLLLGLGFALIGTAVVLGLMRLVALLVGGAHA